MRANGTDEESRFRAQDAKIFGILAAETSGNAFDDFVDDLFMALAGTIDGYLSVFLIERLTVLMQCAKGLARLHNHAARVQIGHSLLYRLIVKFKVHDYAGVRQMPHCLRTIDHAAAGRNDGVGDIYGHNMILLNPAESLDAELVNDLLEAFVLDGLYVHVGIDKMEAQGLGQKHSHGALAHATHPYQDNVPFVCIRFAAHEADFIFILCS